MTTLTLTPPESFVAPSMPVLGRTDFNDASPSGDILRARDLLLDMALCAPRPADGQPLVIADFSRGQAQTSCELLEPAVARLLHQHPDTPVNVIRNDLSGSDFHRIARRIDTAHRAGVCEFLTPGSLHARILPANSLHLGTCFSALHWLTSLPELRVAEHISQEVNDEVYAAAYQAHWQRGWQAFLQSRSQELVEGGLLLVGFDVRPRAGDPVPAPFELLHRAAVSMVEDGHIEAAQLERFQLPIHRPLPEEVMAPFGTKGSGCFCGLRVTHVEVAEFDCPLSADWQRDRNAQRFAFRCAGCIRAFTEPAVRVGLFGEDNGAGFGRSGAQPLLDCLYERVRRLIAEAPTMFELKRTRILLTLRKETAASAACDPA